MKPFKTLGMAATLLMLFFSAQARAVAIDTLSVAQVTFDIDLAISGPGIDASFTQPVNPNAVIQMGVYQGLPSGIIGMSSGFSSATIYTSGAAGAPAPSGTVDVPVPGNIVVDLSSLRASISILGLASYDFELWPVTLPPTMGSYNSATGAYSLSWDVDIMVGGSSKGIASIILEGGVTVVPVPAAVWLFGSGLLGLVGVARRRQRT